MREIKFRAWDRDRNSFVYSDEFGLSAFFYGEEDGQYETKPEQFTGLRDKNGKEIYEGDLIKAPSGRIYAVIFSTWKHEEKRKSPRAIDLYDHTGWCISLDGVHPCDLLDSEVCKGTVIGCIHDNPAFLGINSKK